MNATENQSSTDENQSSTEKMNATEEPKMLLLPCWGCAEPVETTHLEGYLCRQCFLKHGHGELALTEHRRDLLRKWLQERMV